MQPINLMSFSNMLPAEIFLHYLLRLAMAAFLRDLLTQGQNFMVGQIVFVLYPWKKKLKCFTYSKTVFVKETRYKQLFIVQLTIHFEKWIWIVSHKLIDDGFMPNKMYFFAITFLKSNSLHF